MAICGYPIVDGSPCHNFPRQGKKYCWMHDGTPKKNERLKAENAKLKEALQEISDTEDLRFAFGFGYDLNIDTLAKQALKGESDGK